MSSITYVNNIKQEIKIKKLIILISNSYMNYK